MFVSGMVSCRGSGAFGASPSSETEGEVVTPGVPDLSWQERGAYQANHLARDTPRVARPSILVFWCGGSPCLNRGVRQAERVGPVSERQTEAVVRLK